MNLQRLFAIGTLCAVSVAAENVLVSNFTYAIAEGVNRGTIWVLARGDGDYANGYSVIQLVPSTNGIEVKGSKSFLLPSQTVGVHDKVFQSMGAENRRSLLVRSGALMVGQAFSPDSLDEYTQPLGLVRLLKTGEDSDAGIFSVQAAGLGLDASEAWKSPLEVSVHDAAVDKGGRLWLARGPWGVARAALAAASWKGEEALADSLPVFALNAKTAKWDTLRTAEDLDTAKQLNVWALALDSNSGSLWVGSEAGLWRGNRDSSALRRVRLGSVDTLRITGIWADSAFRRIVVESAVILKPKDQPKAISSLWTSWDGGAHFSKVALPYDSLDISVSRAAFLGDTAWLAVQGIENLASGLLKVRGSIAFRWPDSLIDLSREESSQYLWGLEAGVVDRDAIVTSVTTFGLGSAKALAVSTDGAGVAVSADSGRTWQQVLNQKSVKGSLREVRMVPSVMRGYGASLVAYRLGKSAKVTIEVFSYDMRKVKTIIRNEPRNADPLRSTNPRTDIWDGRDDMGNSVAAGMYYVRVRDNKDHEAWGKVLFLGGAQ